MSKMSLQVAERVPYPAQGVETHTNEKDTLILTIEQMCSPTVHVPAQGKIACRASIVPAVRKWLPPSEHLIQLFDSPKAALACA